MISRRLQQILGVFIIQCLCLPAFAQLNLGGGVVLSGNTSFNYQYYTTQNENNAFGSIRQPKHYPQFAANFNFDYKGKLRIPIRIYLSPVVQVSGFGVNTNAEGPKSLNILRYLMHPANQIYLQPKFKDIRFHLGHFIQPYSPLTAGDIKVFGLGAEYDLGAMSFAIQRGVIQPRVANVDFNFNNGSYRRSLTALNFKMKVNKQLRTGVSFALVGDNQNSLETAPMAKTPQRSGVLSISSNYRINKTSHVKIELANTSWAPNLTATDTLREFGVTNFLIPNTNVLGGTAFSLSGATRFEQIKFNGLLSWKSKNYKTLAYPFMQSDMIELKLNPQFTSADKKIRAAASFGYLGSNFSETYGSRLNIPILKLSGGYKFSKDIMVNMVYGFNAVNGAPNAAGQKIKSSNNVLRLLPTYIVNIKQFRNTVSLIIGLSRYANSSDYLPAANKVTTNNYGLSYRLGYQKHSVGVSVNSFKTASGGVTVLRYSTLTLNASTALLDNNLVPFGRITFTTAKNATMKIGSKRMTQLGARYRVNNKISANFSANIHFSKQGVVADSPIFREYIIKAGMNYRL